MCGKAQRTSGPWRCNGGERRSGVVGCGGGGRESWDRTTIAEQPRREGMIMNESAIMSAMCVRHDRRVRQRGAHICQRCRCAVTLCVNVCARARVCERECVQRLPSCNNPSHCALRLVTVAASAFGCVRPAAFFGRKRIYPLFLTGGRAVGPARVHPRDAATALGSSARAARVRVPERHARLPPAPSPR